jgi:hypothetical protein
VQDVATRLPGDFWRVCVAAVVSHLAVLAAVAVVTLPSLTNARLAAPSSDS